MSKEDFNNNYLGQCCPLPSFGPKRSPSSTSNRRTSATSITNEKVVWVQGYERRRRGSSAATSIASDDLVERGTPSGGGTPTTGGGTPATGGGTPATEPATPNNEHADADDWQASVLPDQDELDSTAVNKYLSALIEPESESYKFDEVLKGNNLSPELESELRNVYSDDYDSWLRSYGLQSYWETDPSMRTPLIYHGYRYGQLSATDCMKSFFSPSNETVNVWTHLIPFCLMLFRVLSVYLNMDDPLDAINAPFWIQSFGCLQILMLSSLTHTFSCLSSLASDICFCTDYAGLVLYGLTSVVANEYYLCPLECNTSIATSSAYYIFTMAVAGFFVHALSCQSRVPDPHVTADQLFVQRALPPIVIYSLSAIPCVIRLISNGPGELPITMTEERVCNLGASAFYDTFYALHILTKVLAVAFHASAFPERWFPGRFDIVGNSHQFFHVFITAGLFIQNYLAEHAMNDAQRLRQAGLLGECDVWSSWDIYIPVMLLTLSLAFNIVKYSLALQRVKAE